MKTISLFDPQTGKCHPEGYCPPPYLAVTFRTIYSDILVGVTGRIEVPVLDVQGQTRTDTAFFVLEDHDIPKRVYLIHEVLSWEDPYDDQYLWATPANIINLEKEVKRCYVESSKITILPRIKVTAAEGCAGWNYQASAMVLRLCAEHKIPFIDRIGLQTMKDIDVLMYSKEMTLPQGYVFFAHRNLEDLPYDLVLHSTPFIVITQKD